MANSVLNTRIITCNDTSIAWAESNKVLLEGEIAIEFLTDGQTRIKIGNGNDIFQDLPYALYNKQDTENLIAQAISKIKYTHENQEILDKISSAFTTDLKEKYDIAYEHTVHPHAPIDAQENVIENISVNGNIISPDENKTINISGVAPELHTHDDRYYTESEINAKLNEKSNTSHTHDLSEMINDLSTGDTIPTDNDYYVSQYAKGGTSVTTYHRRPIKLLWEYIKSKLSNVAISGSYNDLSNKPKVGSGKIQIKQNNEEIANFSLDQSSDTIINITDTTYPIGNNSTTGTTKLYNTTGTNSDGTMTQLSLTQSLDKKSDISHNHDDRYYTEQEIDTKLSTKAEKTHTHGDSDITALDASKITSGTIGIEYLPKGALERCVIVTDDTARFKLTNSSVQTGDTVKVTDTGKMYFVIDDAKLASEAGYTVYTAGSATSVPWSGVTGKPSSYTPSSHTQAISTITGLQSALDGKSATSHTHDDLYYTEGEIDEKLITKSDVSHSHDLSEMINDLSTGDTIPTDNDYYVSQYAKGGTSVTTYHRRPIKLLWEYIKSKLSNVAISGSYNDLSNKPSIPSVGNGTITITQNGQAKGTFTTNQSGNTTIALTDTNTDTNTTYTANRGIALDNGAFKLAEYCTLISDWDEAIETGWYMGCDASNAPITGTGIWFYGETISHNPNFARQILYLFAQGSDLASNSCNRYERVRHSGSWGKWLNTSVHKEVPSDAKFTDTNTWRGIQNNLTSTSTTDSLSAAQGKILNEKFNSYLSLENGGTVTGGDISFSYIGNNETSRGIKWSGSTDNASIFYRTDGADAGRLVLNIGDDSNARIDFALNETTKSYIDANGNFSGNARTADRAAALSTARTINGTTFDGTANITTANWGTARTLTIGRTGKSVNGSGNVSWSVADIGAIEDNPHINKFALNNGGAKYLCAARFQVTGEYADSPMELELIHRHGKTPCYVALQFAGVSNLDPEIASLTWFGADYGVFIHKDKASTWSLYITASEGYDSVVVARVQRPSIGVTITYPSENLTTKPTTNIVNATLGGSIGIANNANMLSGFSASSNATANTVATRNGSGELYATHFNQSSAPSTPNTSSYIMFANSDGYLRKSSLANVKTILGLGSAAYTSSDDYASATHKHGLIHNNFTKMIENTSEDKGWAMIDDRANTDVFWLKSLRAQASAPPWLAEDCCAGVAFGGGDTKGVLSMHYAKVAVKFAGGNGTKPNWYFGIRGKTATDYDLDVLNQSGNCVKLGSLYLAPNTNSTTSAVIVNGSVAVSSDETTPLANTDSETTLQIDDIHKYRYVIISIELVYSSSAIYDSKIYSLVPFTGQSSQTIQYRNAIDDGNYVSVTYDIKTKKLSGHQEGRMGYLFAVLYGIV